MQHKFHRAKQWHSEIRRVMKCDVLESIPLIPQEWHLPHLMALIEYTICWVGRSKGSLPEVSNKQKCLYIHYSPPRGTLAITYDVCTAYMRMPPEGCLRKADIASPKKLLLGHLSNHHFFLVSNNACVLFRKHVRTKLKLSATKGYVHT
jgi:hypothetical protein